MNEGGSKQPHDELEGQDEKTSEEESGGPGAEPGPVASKRRHVRSQRMQEYLQQQDAAVPQKLRKCSFPGCEKLFSSNPGLRYHKRTHLPDASNFSCQHCKKEFKSHNGLKYHLQKTKCQDTPADAPASLPPPSPPLSSPLVTGCQERDTRTSTGSTFPPPAKIDEPDSLCSISGESESQNWPEPRHRKMESKRKKMEQAARRTAAEAEQCVQASVPPVCQPLPLERSASSEAGPLLQFAQIATGPQSPLLRTVAMDWEQARLQKESESESARDVVWPRPLWQCFMEGTKVSIGGEEASPPWYPVERIAGVSDVQRPVLPEDLSHPVPVCLLSQQKSAEHDSEVELAFACESSQQSRLTACCAAFHPFFVRNKGWASCDSKRTKEMYGLLTSRLETGDVCLPPSCSRQTSSARDAEGTEVNSLEYSSVVALSEMAQKRSQEGSGGQQQQTAPVTPDDQHAPKAKRPMNAFLLWSQTKRAEFIMKFPKTNNRDISSMLSKEWRRLSESEKKQLQSEAKVKAELQKQQYPDCWKRKHHH